MGQTTLFKQKKNFQTPKNMSFRLKFQKGNRGQTVPVSWSEFARNIEKNSTTNYMCFLKKLI